MGSFAFHGLVICENYVHVCVGGDVGPLLGLLFRWSRVLGEGLDVGYARLRSVMHDVGPGKGFIIDRDSRQRLLLGDPKIVL